MRRKWEKELLPHCLAMGIAYDEFWELTPRKLRVMVEGYTLRRQIEDERSWLLGGYVFQAVTTAMGNSFRKKNQKAKDYFEVVEEPFLKKLDKKDLSDDEKQKRLDALMASLHVMKDNFELRHGK